MSGKNHFLYVTAKQCPDSLYHLVWSFIVCKAPSHVWICSRDIYWALYCHDLMTSSQQPCEVVWRGPGPSCGLWALVTWLVSSISERIGLAFHGSFQSHWLALRSIPKEETVLLLKGMGKSLDRLRGKLVHNQPQLFYVSRKNAGSLQPVPLPHHPQMPHGPWGVTWI